ncbi:MAG: hypothetical protein R3Y57_05620 [Erysipelotrichaceae bacterium]
MINFLFIFFCFVLDCLLASFFPVDFSYQSVFFISQFSFMGLLLVSKRLTVTSLIRWAFIIGIIQDVFNGGHLFMSCGMNLLMLMLYRYWAINLSGSIIEEVILLTSLVFVKESMLFFLYKLLGVISMTYGTFFVYRLFLTCLLAPFSAFILYIINGFTSDWIDSKKRYQDANDNLFGHQFKNK